MSADDAFDSIPDECKPPHQRGASGRVTPVPWLGPRGARRYRGSVLDVRGTIATVTCWSMIVCLAIVLFGAWFGVFDS